MTMATATAMTTMAAASISIATCRGHHPRRVSRQAQPTTLHRCLALQRKQQQLRRRPVVRSGSSAALCRWAGSCVAVLVVFVLALGCHIPTASCTLTRRLLTSDDRLWIQGDQPDSPAYPESILRYIDRTDKRVENGKELQRNLLQTCISSSFHDITGFVFSCESITVNNYKVFYPAFKSDSTATLVTGAEALKEAINVKDGGCSINRFVAAAYWQSVKGQDGADNEVTRFLFTISAMLAFRPKMAKLSRLSTMFEMSAPAAFGNSDELAAVAEPALRALGAYGDFMALELSDESPKVARALLDFMMQQIQRARRTAETEQQDRGNAELQKKRQEERAGREEKREAIRRKYGLQRREDKPKGTPDSPLLQSPDALQYQQHQVVINQPKVTTATDQREGEGASTSRQPHNQPRIPIVTTKRGGASTSQQPHNQPTSPYHPGDLPTTPWDERQELLGNADKTTARLAGNAALLSTTAAQLEELNKKGPFDRFTSWVSRAWSG